MRAFWFKTSWARSSCCREFPLCFRRLMHGECTHPKKTNEYISLMFIQAGILRPSSLRISAEVVWPTLSSHCCFFSTHLKKSVSYLHINRSTYLFLKLKIELLGTYLFLGSNNEIILGTYLFLGSKIEIRLGTYLFLASNIGSLLGTYLFWGSKIETFLGTLGSKIETLLGTYLFLGIKH